MNTKMWVVTRREVVRESLALGLPTDIPSALFVAQFYFSNGSGISGCQSLKWFL
jgi:hypothetical protein